MSSIESQLSEYRLRKARERRKETSSVSQEPTPRTGSSSHSRATIVSSIMGILDFFRRDPAPQLLTQVTGIDPRVAEYSQDYKCESPEQDDDKLITKNCMVACSTESSTKQKIIAALPPLLKFTLWIVLWGLFLELGFGAVYFVVSLLIIMWYSMRTRPRKSGEMSAYSVFNPGQEKLDGTFTAEQFERELRYGALAVH